jgi:phospholipase C
LRYASFKTRTGSVGLLVLAFAACNAGHGFTEVAPPLPNAVLARHSAIGKIQHIVIVVQENRSLNNLFYGFPGATTVKYGRDSSGHLIELKPIGLESTWDIDHSSTSFFAACNGTGSIPGTNCRMNGFNNETVYCGRSSEPPCPIKYPPYAYVPHSETTPYFAMASQYVLADQMYTSDFDASSFVSHQYIIAGQSESALDYPDGAWGCPGGPNVTITEVGPQRKIPNGSEVACWNTKTLGDELDAANISWAYYATYYSGTWGMWDAYQVIKHIYYGRDWAKDMRSPPSQFLTDVANGRLRAVSWVTPTCGNSDHGGCGSKTGPAWVASLVNAVGQSKYWDSTAIFIFWDDYGGWYDSEAPAYVDYDGLGIRVPMLIISPYAKKGHVSHVHFEHGSILKFVEDQFKLSRLSASDNRANSPGQDCFNFNRPPRKFQVIPAAFDEQYFLHQPADNRIPDAQ